MEMYLLFMIVVCNTNCFLFIFPIVQKKLQILARKIFQVYFKYNLPRKHCALQNAME